MHLDDPTYLGLLHGTLPAAEARRLALHLDAPCDACEAFLAGRAEADGLDGLVDARLVALAPPGHVGAGNDLEFARIRRMLHERPGRRWLPALAVAATLAVAGLAGLLLRPAVDGSSWDGDKGSATAVPLRLRFLVVTPAVGGPPSLEKGVDGQEVPAVASLQFQVELGRAANVLLARVRGAGPPEVFFSARLPAGRNVVSVAGRPAAYPLDALAGPQRFLALASEAPLIAADAAQAAGLAARAAQDEGPVISLAQVEVRVRP